MALMWCFIGILLGLFIITMAFLYVERKRKKRDQQIFRLSQLHSEGSAIQSPTIYPSLQFQELHEVENTHETASKPCGSEYNGHASILKDDNSMFINPLWRDSKNRCLRYESKKEIGTIERERLISKSMPCNLSGKIESDYVEMSGVRRCENNSTGDLRNTIENMSSGKRTGASDAAASCCDGTSSSFSKRKEERAIVANYLNKNPTKKREVLLNFNQQPASTIEVGIISHPVASTKIFLSQSSRQTRADVINRETEEPDKKSEGEYFSETLVGKKLLSKFGLDNEDHDGNENSRNTTLSTPCLRTVDFNNKSQYRGKLSCCKNFEALSNQD